MDQNNSKVTGIFSQVLPLMVSKCCGCCREHNRTVTHFENPSQTISYRKSGVNAFRSAVNDDIELHFPMHGQLYQVKYYKRYEFIPLVQSPGVAFLVLEEDKHTPSLLLLNAISESLPIVLLMIVLSLLMGIVVWFVEHFQNIHEFPASFTGGVQHGVWWAIVTVTTIG